VYLKKKNGAIFENGPSVWIPVKKKIQSVVLEVKVFTKESRL